MSESPPSPVFTVHDHRGKVEVNITLPHLLSWSVKQTGGVFLLTYWYADGKHEAYLIPNQFTSTEAADEALREAYTAWHTWRPANPRVMSF